MTVIEFLADYAQLVIDRASKEGFAVQALYQQSEAADGSMTSSVELVAPNGSGINIAVGWPLDGLLSESYKPELTTEQWLLFLAQAKPHRFQQPTGTLQ